MAVRTPCCEVCVVSTKLMAHGLGGLVNLLFLALALIWFVHPEKQLHLVSFCAWLAQGALGVCGCAFGLSMEVRGATQTVSTSTTAYAMNQMILFVWYLWLGCYLIGSKAVTETGLNGSQQDGWKTTSCVAGIAAWIVAVVDLLLAGTGCCTNSPTASSQPSPATGQASHEQIADIEAAEHLAKSEAVVDSPLGVGASVGRAAASGGA